MMEERRETVSVLSNTISKEEDYENISASEDEENDETKHSKLLEAIGSLDGKKRRQIVQRTEPSATMSEYNLSESNKDRVKLHELLSSLKQISSHTTIKKQLRSAARKSKTLDSPLPTAQVERIKRSLAFEKVKKDLSKWDPVVEKNRFAEQIVYPLKQPSFSLVPAATFVKRFQTKTPLELEVAKMLGESSNVITQDKELTQAEEEALKAMSLEEAQERHRELQKARALLSYREAKARRRNKIKSKKYHRILKRERLKKDLKEFEELNKTDPELALEKLEDLERQRILERVTLKHRNTGKWAKQQKLRAKYDEQSREQLREQLELSRHLTKKIVAPSESEEEEIHLAGHTSGENKSTDSVVNNFFSSSNPWLKQASLKSNKLNSVDDKVEESCEKEDKCNNIRPKECVSEETCQDGMLKQSKDDGGCQQNSKNKTSQSVNSLEHLNSLISKKQQKNKKIKNSESIDDIFDLLGKKRVKDKSSRENVKLSLGRKDIHSNEVINKDEENEEKDPDMEEHLINETLAQKKTLEDFEDMSEPPSKPVGMCSDKKIIKSTSNHFENSREGARDSKVQIDPHNFICIKTQDLDSQVPQLLDGGDEAIDEVEDEHRMNILEAFADDDVLNEFKEEKKSVINKDKPKDLDLFLPGWGSWGGSGIKPSKRKRQRFLIKMPPGPCRKDHTLGNVIINQKQDEKVSSHQVTLTGSKIFCILQSFLCAGIYLLYMSL
ncbi:U3 small nucleolar RNA-associated protein 14 homolog A-like [Tachypleus tridentatus]|uniref:U3 small nucleolar RNA-associated protein 14 homolog A-like n=1 Tax=Tachypleus tridentatus TaxID=6853 RepID=UPI003FD556AD